MGMAENGASKNELKLLEIIKEKDERIEQLEKALNAKDVLNESLQMEFEAKENLIKFLEEKLGQLGVSAVQVDSGSLPMKADAEKSDEKERKIMKEKVDEVQWSQSENAMDSASDLDSEASAVELAAKVVGIELILLKVLKSMRTGDLLQNCRLVSREWRDLSTQVLLRRTKFQVELRCSSYDSEFAVGSESNSSRTLGELTTFLSTSKSFPCAHFIFKGNVKSPDAQGFLSQFGSCVKGLKLIGPQKLSSIRNLLMEQIPHLETLQLSRFVPEESSVSRPAINLNLLNQFHQHPGVFVIPAALPAPPPAPVPAPQILTRIFSEDFQAPQFPFLVSLKLGEGNSASLVQEILKAAPNLQQCFGIRSKEELETLSSRIHVVKSLKLKPGTRQSITIASNLDKMMPILGQLHLTSLEVDHSSSDYRRLADEDASFCNMISALLNSSQSSLKKFKFTPDPDFKRLIQWPQMNTVGKLTLSGDLRKDFVRIFPRPEKKIGMEVGVSKNFPYLHTIHLKKIPAIKDDHLRFFEHLPQISTVKSLKISRPEQQIVELFVPLFPNLKHLALGTTYSFFCDFAPTIWQIKGLKSLEIDFDCEWAEIDAGFTGMEESTCVFLASTGRCRLTPEEVDKFRVKPSILDATELEHLILPRGFSEKEDFGEKDEHDYEYEYDEKKNCIPTFVSYKYALKLMPKLCVFS